MVSSSLVMRWQSIFNEKEDLISYQEKAHLNHVICRERHITDSPNAKAKVVSDGPRGNVLLFA